MPINAHLMLISMKYIISGCDYVCIYVFIKCVSLVSTGQMCNEFELKYWNRCFKTVSEVLNYTYILFIYFPPPGCWLPSSQICQTSFMHPFIMFVCFFVYVCVTVKCTSFSQGRRRHKERHWNSRTMDSTSVKLTSSWFFWKDAWKQTQTCYIPKIKK